ncbi:FAD:protein FMN transferase [Phragmitibacter flavus]|nr:FAD:protein FMN transferase [Phragmitibacter flavus]
MATQFEVVIAEDEGVDEAYAASSAQAAFAEIDRLEDELSRYLPMSDIARIQQLRAGEHAPVGLAAMDCLQLAALVQAETAGAFDISVGPLMGIYRNQDGTPRTPQPGEIEEARTRIGAKVYKVEEEGFVRALVDFPALDLGAIGKGYALDQAAALLLEWQVTRVLLNAGDSTVLAMQSPPGMSGWAVNVGNAQRVSLSLCERAVSGSGFQVKGGHIMNPRTMEPLPVKAERVWALAPTAALSDAMSTAFAVMEAGEIVKLCARIPEIEAIGD